MGNELIKITEFVVDAFLHIWPYLLLTIPLAVAVNMSGASKYIKRAFDAGPIAAVFLATAVGAFSPFCSCGVIPVIAALLIGGVPLAPVMSFWIASPSMDPEIFFLSVGTIGWNMAVWRLVGTLVLSLTAGFITHLAIERNWISKNVLRNRKAPSIPGPWAITKTIYGKLKAGLQHLPAFKRVEPIPAAASSCCGDDTAPLIQIQPAMQGGSVPASLIRANVRSEV